MRLLMAALVLRGDAAHLPLPDASADLIVTSPPYFALRSYADGGEHYDGQIGSEATPQAYLEALWACTAEWVRVLEPSGSVFVNLGDKYSTGNSGQSGLAELGKRWAGGGHSDGKAKRASAAVPRMPPKSLLGLPWRYAIGCMDRLGLILRAEIIWAKPNGLPESVTDRVRRSHEQIFHFTRQPRYYSAVDEIREPHAAASLIRYRTRYTEATNHSARRDPGGNVDYPDGMIEANPLGKLPGSVWEIPSAPLTVPAHLGVDHFAAYPPELCRRIVLGWSPPGVCTGCSEGRRPVTSSVRTLNGEPRDDLPAWADPSAPRRTPNGVGHWRFGTDRNHLGYACACTPYTDHPDRRRPSVTPGRALGRGHQDNDVRASELGTRHHGNDWPERTPTREYHFEDWTPPLMRPAVVVDPFGGTGTTALVASAYGRVGITIDRSADYCRLARWRTRDPAERARAMNVPKPPPVPDGQQSLFDETEAS